MKKLFNSSYVSRASQALVLLMMLFGRSFTGTYLFGFRIGEIIIGVSILFSFYFLFIYFKNGEKINKLFLLLILHTIFNHFYVSGFNLDLYFFRASSYIWIISIFFVYKHFKMELLSLRTGFFILFFVYFLNEIYFPDSIANFFLNNSDKFEYLKAADIFIIYLTVVYICKPYFSSNKVYLNFILYSLAMFMPMLIFRSKGSFFGSVIFFVIILIFYLKEYFLSRNNLIHLIAISIVFFISSFLVYGNLSFDKGDLNIEDESYNIISNLNKIDEIVESKNTTEIFFSFYTKENRLYSTDVTANWRLQIWQDIFSNAIKNNHYFYGFGYKEILPSMDDPERIGSDGLNENPHNFLIYILGRGGLIQVFLILAFYFELYSIAKRKNITREFLLYTIPLIFVSLFDGSMESVRFPFLFYAALGYSFRSIKNE